MIGSVDGVSGINPIVDRLNSIAPNGSQVSGTNVTFYGAGTFSGTSALINTSGATINRIYNNPDMNTNKFTNMGAGTSAYDSVRVNQVYFIYGDVYAWTCAGNKFMPEEPETQNITYLVATGMVTAEADNISFVAPVELPHGATVTAVQVFGNVAAEAEEWTLRRIRFSDSAVYGMANAAINTSDTSISNEVIDNNSYGYWLGTTTLDTDDQIWGAKIIYQFVS